MNKTLTFRVAIAQITGRGRERILSAPQPSVDGSESLVKACKVIFVVVKGLP
jgi:hypothetical protein